MAEADPSASFADELMAGWLPGAMFPSETLWFGQIVQEQAVEAVIECGRQDGVSTWTLATMLRGTGIEILSIDFDEDPERLERTEERLRGLDATCISGDIHEAVPRLLEERQGQRVAVLQDGPKGWEGLATLTAAAHQPQVAVVAQHNLHLGHRSRAAFISLSGRPCFLEGALPRESPLRQLRDREVVELARRTPNRPTDHSSLGVIVLDESGRATFERQIDELHMGPWHPRRVLRHWDTDDFAYCSRVRTRSRWTAERFRRR